MKRIIKSSISTSLSAPSCRQTVSWARPQHIFLILATYVVLTVGASLYLNNRLGRIFSDSVKLSQQWTQRQADYSQLAQAAMDVTAPPNDVFASHDVGRESARLHAALPAFKQKMTAARQDLQNNVPRAEADLLLEKLHRVEQEMDDVLAEAAQVFSLFTEHQPEKAGARMAIMDRQYYDVNNSLANLGAAVNTIQKRHFDRSLAMAANLRRFESFLAAAILLMVGGIVLYGRKLTQDAAALERNDRAHQEAIGASERRFRALSTSAPIGIYLTDPHGSCLYTNPHWQRIVGLSLDESLGDGWRHALHPDDAAKVVAARDRSTNEGADLDCEFRFRRKDGEVRWVHALGTCIRSDTGDVIGRVGTLEDITERNRREAELEKTQRELVEASRQAGMAEVATGVLHNVGNVLNSVNVASTCVADSLRKSKAASLSKVVLLLREHEADLGAFLTSDPKGQQIPGYLAKLADHLVGEQTAALDELAHLQKNIEHIKEIVTMQQTCAKGAGAAETIQATDLVEDALRMNLNSLTRHQIELIKEFDAVPPISIQKHKVLQILINLIRNATQACEAADRNDKRMIIRVRAAACRAGIPPSGASGSVLGSSDRLRISVTDNGVGIAPENLSHIFVHGFTTKKDGHGFGLHSAVLAAREMGGDLCVESDGLGQGATFTLELPVQRSATNPVVVKPLRQAA